MIAENIQLWLAEATCDERTDMAILDQLVDIIHTVFHDMRILVECA